MASLTSLSVYRWDRRNALILLTSILLLWLVLSPLLSLFSSFDTAASQSHLLDTAFLTLYFKSLLTYILVAFLALLTGATLAYLLIRFKLPGRTVLLLILTTPLFIPSYIHAMSWSRMFADNGILNHLLPGSVHNFLSGWLATLWVLVLSYYPIALLAVVAGLQRWDRQRQESAQLYAGTWGAIRLEWSYLRNYLLFAALLIFFLAFSDFGVPDYFQVHVYATEVFIQLSAYLNMEAAILASVLPLAVSLSLLWWVFRLLKKAPHSMSGDTKSSQLCHLLGRWQWPTMAVLLGVILIVVILPMANLLYMGAEYKTLLRAFRMVKLDLVSSAFISLTTSVAATCFALLLAYGYSRKIRPSGSWLRVLTLTLLIVPSSLVALGLIRYWNQEGILGWFYQSGMVLGVGLILRWLPVLFELMLFAWAQQPASQEEVAMVSGIKWGRAFWQINLRQMLPVIIFISLLGFILAFNELTMTVMLAPAGVSTLPIRIFSTVHYGPDQLLAAICLIQVLILMIPVGLLFWLVNRFYSVKGTA